MSTALNIHPQVAAMADAIIRHRRYFHQHPELSFKEYKTAEYILDQIGSVELDIRHPVAETGITAAMNNGEGPCIALRADMDALPIRETGEAPYKSRNDGVMHACGHDGHMAILLGTLLALDRLRDHWQGTVKFIFQPAEEGFSGARHMVDAGVLHNPDVSAIFGLHLWNYQDFGTVGVKPGPTLAAADDFAITVKGKGGHGAAPQGTVDAIHAAAQLVVALQSIVSRNTNPLDSAVVTIGEFHGGHNFNIIADEVQLTGTARAYEESNRLMIKSRLEEICAGVGATYGATITLDYHDCYPPTINDGPLSELVLQAAKRIVGSGAGEPYLSMGGEDMSFFLQQVPGCFFFVGSAKPEHQLERVPHHCSHFDFDENALLVGASVFLEIVQEMLPVKGPGTRVV